MKELTIEQLADAYEDYFSVEHGISINAKPIAGALPTAGELVAAIPTAVFIGI